MAGERHTRDDVEGFLDHEFRQVWAVDRETGEYHYLEAGTAADHRKTAKTDWKCPVPGCDGRINTRGGSRRDHFYHLDDVDHAPESEFHLSAKAMLTTWASGKYPTCTVREEPTLKLADYDVIRRPDVLVTGGSRPVALEVEYKAFSEEGWAAKQSDFERIEHTCAWLIGHQRIVRATLPAGEHGPSVKTTPLMRAMGSRGMHVFAINPVARKIATLSGDPAFRTLLSQHQRVAWLWIHDLDDCALDATTGLATPGTRRITAAIEARDQQARAERERLQRQAAHDRKQAELRGARAAQSRADRLRREQRYRQAEQAREETWNASPLRAAMLKRWGYLPPEIVEPINMPRPIYVHRSQWQAMLYEQFVYSAREPFTVADVDAYFLSQRMPSADRSYRIPRYECFLQRLADDGLMDVSATDGHLVYTPFGHDFNDIADRTTHRPCPAARPTGPNPVAVDEPPVQQPVEEGWPQRALLDRWERSPERAKIFSLFGHLPEFIAWKAMTLEERQIEGVLPAHWHARLFLDHLHARPIGHPVVRHEVISSLQRQGLCSSADADVTAVHAYLHNLRQRGLLNDDEDEYTVGIEVAVGAKL
jgi:hypothetical protein